MYLSNSHASTVFFQRVCLSQPSHTITRLTTFLILHIHSCNFLQFLLLHIITDKEIGFCYMELYTARSLDNFPRGH